MGREGKRAGLLFARDQSKTSQDLLRDHLQDGGEPGKNGCLEVQSKKEGVGRLGREMLKE